MSGENKRIVQRLFEGIGNGKMALGEEIFSDCLVFHRLSMGEDENLDDINQRFASLREAFAELSARVENQISVGDRVATRISWCGSFPEENLGGATTVMQIKWQETAIFRLDGDRIVEGWGKAGLAEGLNGIDGVETASLSPGSVVGPAGRTQMEEAYFPAPETLRTPRKQGEGRCKTGLTEGFNEINGGATTSPPPSSMVGPATEGQIEESYHPVPETLRAQQEQLEAKDRQISELHHLLQQAQTALAVPTRSRRTVSWWRWLLGRER